MNLTVKIVLTLIAAPLLLEGHSDPIGLHAFRRLHPTLNGAGLRIAQPEAGSTNWQVNPGALGLPASIFTWQSSQGETNSFPNELGNISDHANQVATSFYGPAGPSWSPAGIHNYPASYFYDSIIGGSQAIPATVINQSFVFTVPLPEQDTAYDNYVVNHLAIIVTAAGNGGVIPSPASAHNVISVGAFEGSSSFGPTADGRCKPDLVAPSFATSFSTPLVSGAAAVLVQAGRRGDGGADTNSTTDPRSIKAILLNSARKPSNWTNSPTRPLDARFGSGVLNILNAHHLLSLGKLTRAATTQIPLDENAPVETNSAVQQGGWDLNALSNSVLQDGVAHYSILVSNQWNTPAAFTATLTWHRRQSSTLINDVQVNNLDLLLRHGVSGQVIASSVSTVDNVEHLYLPALPPGPYELQVIKHGGALQSSNEETYALAVDSQATGLQISQEGLQVRLRWPAIPAGFELEERSVFDGTWSASTALSEIVDGFNQVNVPSTNFGFFRLIR